MSPTPRFRFLVALDAAVMLRIAAVPDTVVAGFPIAVHRRKTILSLVQQIARSEIGDINLVSCGTPEFTAAMAKLLGSETGHAPVTAVDSITPDGRRTIVIGASDRPRDTPTSVAAFERSLGGMILQRLGLPLSSYVCVGPADPLLTADADLTSRRLHQGLRRLVQVCPAIGGISLTSPHPSTAAREAPSGHQSPVFDHAPEL